MYIQPTSSWFQERKLKSIGSKPFSIRNFEFECPVFRFYDLNVGHHELSYTPKWYYTVINLFKKPVNISVSVLDLASPMEQTELQEKFIVNRQGIYCDSSEIEPKLFLSLYNKESGRILKEGNVSFEFYDAPSAHLLKVSAMVTTRNYFIISAIVNHIKDTIHHNLRK